MVSLFSRCAVFWIGASTERLTSPVPALSQQTAANQSPPIPAIPTIFPNSVAKNYYNDTAREYLTKPETKDRYCITPLLNRQQAFRLFDKIYLVLKEKNLDASALPVCAEIISTLDQIRELICRIETEEIPIEAWADMSLKTEQILIMFTQFENRSLSRNSHLKFIKQNLEFLQFTSRIMWAQFGHATLIKHFTAELAELVATDPAFNELQTDKVNIEVSTPVEALSIRGEGGVQHSRYVDDEGYLITTDVKSGSIAANLKLPFGKLTGQGAGTIGTYQYSRFAEAHALCNFNQLLQKDAHSPIISRLFSRAATLNQASISKTNEMTDFYSMQKNYIRDEQLIARSFSLLLSLDYSPAVKISTRGAESQQQKSCYKKYEQTQNFEIENYVASRAQIKTFDLKTEVDGSVNEIPKIRVHPLKKAVLLNGELTTTTGTVAAKLGIDESFAQINIAASTDWTKKKTRAIRYSTFCDLLSNPFGDARDYRCKEKLREELESKGATLREKLHSFWFPAAPDYNFVLTLEENNALLKKKFRPFLIDQKRQEYSAQEFHVYRNMPKKFLWLDIQRLSQDFAAYSNLHAQHAQGHFSVDASITAFQHKYGAQNTEQCLQKMAVLCAYLYTLLDDAPIGQSKQFRDQLLKLETEIHATGIPHRPEVLRKLACAQQDYFIETDDKTVQGSIKCSLPTSLVNVDIPEVGVKVLRRSLLHFNPLRSGDYITCDISIGAGATVNDGVIAQLSTFLSGHTLPDISSYLPSGSDKNILSSSGKIIYTFKLFKPADSEHLPYVILFRRELSQSGCEISPKVAIPIPGFAKLILGFTHTQTALHTKGDAPSSDSLLNYATHYLHALFTTKTVVNRETRVDLTNQRSYWHKLLEQEETLRQLFLNFAEGTEHRLHAELAYIKKRFLQHASISAKEELAQAVEALLTASRIFKADRSNFNYDEALCRFTSYLQMLYGHWMMTREKSEAYGFWTYDLDGHE